MIYLIGGPPMCGKTTQAKEMGREKNLPILSCDYITAMVVPYISDKDLDHALPLTYHRRRTNHDNDAFYSEFTPQEVVDMYIQNAKTTWPAIEQFIRYALSEENSYILEGYQILPELTKELADSEQVHTEFLTRTDKEDILRSMENADNHWAACSKNPGTREKIADMIVLFSEEVNMQMKEK